MQIIYERTKNNILKTGTVILRVRWFQREMNSHSFEILLSYDFFFFLLVLLPSLVVPLISVLFTP